MIFVGSIGLLRLYQLYVVRSLSHQIFSRKSSNLVKRYSNLTSRCKGCKIEFQKLKLIDTYKVLFGKVLLHYREIVAIVYLVIDSEQILSN